jgi:cyclopropane-fatty-acyl-phospholipid synthase
MKRADQVLWAGLRAFSRSGSITITFADGTRRTTGSNAPAAEVVVNDADAARALVTGGSLGLAEAYISGSVDTPDLLGLLRWGARNQEGLVNTAGSLLRPLRAGWQKLASTTGHASVETMADHYNLGNEFYAAWLDPTMTYSAARFGGPDVTLTEAQLRKYESIAQLAGLEPGMRVLEIGCGWGGFAEYAASTLDVAVTGLTIAEEQAVFARKRLAEAGLAGTTEIRLEDFRDTKGRWDAVVSIEMIESVDETVWPALFDAFGERVVPGGTAVMQAITIRDDLFAGYRRRQDFIQRYIFPGGQCPSPRHIRSLATDADLAITAVETFGLDYARTLAAWTERFEGAWAGIVADPVMGTELDERFRRMWLFYLAYCEAGFREGTIDVGQWAFTSPA